ncbi:Site-specific recombinase XerD [Saccharopolyspora shandongensis]|uniref:Site-specific recombinase XerD n=1 Tax=Saccharopolyspora shandongensis TaxID=418495 RepID=A0A1H3U3Y5_9PSEU|nr:tyrosine-type recombinase/integrase [Saccharopolyspora shandongensis]SDZ57163.1 Site-specific recombinase XerD [Saccharopolyspora shandongensis]
MAWADPLPGGSFRGGYRDSAGKKQYVKDGNGKTRKFGRKKDARDAATEEELKASRRAAIANGSESARISWGAWWDSISDDRDARLSDTNSTEHCIVEKYIRPKWGDVPLNQIITKGSTEKGVQEWVNDVTAGRVDGWKREQRPAPSYVRRIYAVFQASMTIAHDKKILSASPCVGIKLPTKSKRAKPYLDTDRAGKMGEHLREDYRDAVEFSVETGIRPGELCGLHVHSVDRERGWMWVREVLVSRRRVIRPFPKDDDVRAVPLTPKALDIYDRQIDGRDLTRGCGLEHTDGTTCTNALVFLSKRGRPMRPDGIGDCMRRAARKAKIPVAALYAARRGFATRAAEGGLDVFALADVMGHANINQTKEYVQQTHTARARVIAALGETPHLAVIHGTAGANPGADSSQQPPSGTVIEAKENAS